MAYYIGGTAVVDTTTLEYVSYNYIGGDGAGFRLVTWQVGIYKSGQTVVCDYDSNCNCNCNCNCGG